MDLSEQKKSIDKFFESKTDAELKELWNTYSFYSMNSNVVRFLPIETLRENAEKWVFDINGDVWSNNDDTAPDNFGSFIMGATYILELYNNSKPKINLSDKYLPKAGKTKWKLEFINELLSATNIELLDIVLDNQQPDDYDGMFTKNGEWKKKISEEFFENKLENDHWL